MMAREQAKRAPPRVEERREGKQKTEEPRQLDMNGKKCSCTKCSPGNQPFPLPWQERIIHYAYEWELSNTELLPWIIVPPSLYEHLTSRIFLRLAKPLQRISLMNQINQQYDIFSEYIQNGRLERGRF